MVLIYGLLLLVLASFSVADPDVCPNPDKAINLIHEEVVHVEAASFGRVEKTIFIPPEKLKKHVSCITETGIESAGPSGTVSISAIAITRGGIAIRLVSQIKQGIDVKISAYTD